MLPIVNDHDINKIQPLAAYFGNNQRDANRLINRINTIVHIVSSGFDLHTMLRWLCMSGVKGVIGK